MIAVDWGTTSFRARRLDAAGAVLDGVDAPRGILSVTDFPGALRELVGAWLAAGERRVLMCGMVGSRQGWVEAPYVPCPAGPEEIARHLVPVPFEGAAVWLAPGLADRDGAGVPEVMRGEETQLLAVLAGAGAGGTACLPGTHTKWARIADGRVAGFATYMTGEVFAALRGHTILGRLMAADAPHDPAAFARGLERSTDAAGLLHHLFGVRTTGLADELAPEAAASYLSGLLIGHELAEALPIGSTVQLIGAPALCARYAEAIAWRGGRSTTVAGEPAVAGLHALGEHVPWT